MTTPSLRLLPALLSFVASVAAAPLPSRATTMWLIDGSQTDDTLYRLDVDSRALTVVGAMGFDYTQGGLGFAPDGTLYAFTNSPGHGLYTIELGTGAGSLVGGGPYTLQTVYDSFDIDPTTGDGLLWQAGSLGGGLYDLDLASVTASLHSTAGVRGLAIAFATDGSLYRLDGFGPSPALSLVDVDNGSVTPIGATGQPAVGWFNLAFNPSDGMLYSLTKRDSSGASAYLLRIDPTTGVGTDLGLVSVPTGVVFQTSTFSPIPEPGSAALLGLGLAGLSAARRRRAPGRREGAGPRRP